MARKFDDGSDIVDLLASEPMAAKFSAPALLEGYWDGLSEGQSVPYRSQLDPRAIEAVLEYSFVLERIAPGVCRFRLAGNHLNELMGQEVRGMPATAMFQAESRKEISRMLEKVCSQACLMDVHLTAESGFGRGALQARLFLAPLLDDRGNVTRILGCLQSQGRIGRQPRRFSVMNATSKTPNFDVTNVPPISTKIPQVFAETAAKFTHQETPQKPAHGLRLVVDNS